MPTENDVINNLKEKITKTKKAEKKEELKSQLKDLVYNIEHFNKSVKEVIPELWNLNKVDNITYLTKSDLEKLRKQKSNKFAVIDLTPDELILNTGFDTYFTFDFNIITYGGSENARKKANYRNHLVNTNFNFPKTRIKNKNQKKLIDNLEKEKEGIEKVLSRENIIVTLTLAQDIIKRVVETGEKINFSKFAKEESKKNKAELKGQKILIQSAIVANKLYKEIGKYKNKVQLVSAKRIKEAIINKENVFIGFPLIKKYIRAKSSFGPIGFSSVNTLNQKVVFNPSSGKIISFLEASAPLNYRSFRTKEISKLFP